MNFCLGRTPQIYSQYIKFSAVITALNRDGDIENCHIPRRYGVTLE